MKLLFEEEATNAPLPDLILTDWNLPKISGSELLQRIKKHERLRKIPVLIFLHQKPTRTSMMRMTTMPTATSRSPAALRCWPKSSKQSSNSGLPSSNFRRSCGNRGFS